MALRKLLICCCLACFPMRTSWNISRNPGGARSLPTNFVRDVIMKAPSKDMMNTLSRSILTLYAYDANADDISLSNVLRQCLTLI